MEENNLQKTFEDFKDNPTYESCKPKYIYVWVREKNSKRLTSYKKCTGFSFEKIPQEQKFENLLTDIFYEWCLEKLQHMPKYAPYVKHDGTFTYCKLIAFIDYVTCQKQRLPFHMYNIAIANYYYYHGSELHDIVSDSVPSWVHNNDFHISELDYPKRMDFNILQQPTV
jgi:hypothetical protein